MSAQFSSASKSAVLILLALAAGCSSKEAPQESTKTVEGALDLAQYPGIVVPGVVAQDASGKTFAGRVNANGTFQIALPPGASYRLFITDLRASGRFSVESRLLWPGRQTWAAIPSGGAAGSTSDGAPISLGNIRLVSGVVGGLTNDGTGPAGGTGGAGGVAGAGGAAGTGAGGTSGGTTIGGTTNDGTSGGATNGGTTSGGTTTGGTTTGGTTSGGTTTGGTTSGGSVGGSLGTSFGGTTGDGSGTAGGGTGSGGAGSGSFAGGAGTSNGTTGGAGSTGDGTGTGGTGSGSFGGTGGNGGTGAGSFGAGSPVVAPGVPLCVPGVVTVSEGSSNATVSAAVPPQNESGLIPPCHSPTTSSSPSASAPPPPSTTQPGAPTCEPDKQAVFKDGRWDCVKMETPVTYFYSDKPIKVRASVEFPKGVMTQWYPAVIDSYPQVADKLLLRADSKAKACTTVLGAVGANNGLLDWGTLDVLGRDANVDAGLPAAPLDRFTWSFARQVAANPVKVQNGQLEKFLFYRGVGNFALPVRVMAKGGGQLMLSNLIDDKIGSVFFLNVTHEKGTYSPATRGIAPKGALAGAIPSLDGASDVETYADALARSVRTALDDNGLFDDEATAMVNTWKRQWFRTPGARLLYIAPQSWTDASIPLSIEPKPDSTKRVMVIRVEIITPELEAQDTAALRGLVDPKTAPAARDHFAALGRFAEPRLRRAMALLGHPSYAEPLLAEVIETNHTKHTEVSTKPLAADNNGPKYAGKGFVVHEWGTDTIVVGSDGSQLLGLQHEEEDLPRFVYDRTHDRH